jgi:hypothetical protein
MARPCSSPSAVSILQHRSTHSAAPLELGGRAYGARNPVWVMLSHMG